MILTRVYQTIGPKVNTKEEALRNLGIEKESSTEDEKGNVSIKVYSIVKYSKLKISKGCINQIHRKRYS